MRILYRGHFEPTHSTESHVSRSLELLGHEVVRAQESTVSWQDTMRFADGCDLFLWTSTWDFQQLWPHQEMTGALRWLADRMPTVAYHLDLYGRLSREWQVIDRRRGNAMFGCQWVFTPDGDSGRLWERADVNHRFLPPGVFGPECVDGMPRDEYRSDVAFVGSWQGYAHAEHAPYRAKMMDLLRGRYGDQLGLWPRVGQPAVRGQALNDLYASVKVVAGDSCLAHLPETHFYWSDRVPETVGRGGFLVHPAVEGLMESLPEGMGISYYPKNDFDGMIERIDWWLAHDDEREEARCKGQAFIRENHTYEHRMRQVLDVLATEGAWG